VNICIISNQEFTILKLKKINSIEKEFWLELLFFRIVVFMAAKKSGKRNVYPSVQIEKGT